MKREEIDRLIENWEFDGESASLELVETHISWVILSDNFAFKIKRPVKYSFVDFSTLRKRRHYCCEEIKLNSRLAPEMYISVLPVTEKMLEGGAMDDDDRIIDYMVKMERMDSEREMDRLLATKEVRKHEIEKLAEKIAGFHKRVRIIKNAFDTIDFQETFNDISGIKEYVKKELGLDYESIIKRSTGLSDSYLNSRRSYFNDRIIRNFRRNCHGDLNASNIFLYNDPVIFDCIDFNKKLRFIDVLNEIAFLCVDLDFYGFDELSEHFYNTYIEAYGAGESELSRQLFMYYKAYRANVRAKVTAISDMDDDGGEANKREAVKKYLDLLDRYQDTYSSD